MGGPLLGRSPSAVSAPASRTFAVAIPGTPQQPVSVAVSTPSGNLLQARRSTISVATCALRPDAPSALSYSYKLNHFVLPHVLTTAHHFCHHHEAVFLLVKGSISC